jgi:glycosyltransferase involved in cell wall biosynthesis
MTKNIFIILPFKESLKNNLAGAVSIFVQDTTKISKFRKYIKVISSDGLDKKRLFRNKNYILNFCTKYYKKKIDIFEIHNRPEYLSYIKKYFPLSKINLFFHNDPLSLRGSETVKERESIINITNKLIFNSRWTQKKFYSGLKNIDISESLILPHGIEKLRNINLSKKEKNILFVGKLNKSKGYDIFCETANKFKKYDPSWNFISIGNETRREIFPKKGIVNELGYLKNSEVLEYYEKSEIAIGNSTWDEPLGRIASEAISRKCLPVISNKAGLSESKKIAHVLKDNTSKEIFDYLKKITSNKKYRRKKQNLFYKNHNFELKDSAKSLDDIRDEKLKNSSHLTKSINKKILHIANFNENSDGRLFYSFANKINNGFVKNNHILETISDRSFLKLNKSIINPFSNTKKLNDKIFNTLKNFSPHMLLIGHVFNIDDKIFSYCKEKNIKICSWYIDSLSKEFLNHEKKKNFLNNLKYVDHCFITSSPEIFKKERYFYKLRFIPNPVDNSIDNFKSFENKKLEFDIFTAISHGQNRVLLKKGKSDERDKLIKDLIYELPEIKFATFGTDNFEPIWGSNYYYFLSKSKMALNISRGSYQKLYSSDRISSLIGNGLLVFVNKKTKLDQLFTNKEVVFYKDQKDLIDKIRYYSNNDKIRIKSAKLAYNKYHKFMNNKIISNYMLSCVGLMSSKKPYWHDKI